MPRVKPVFTIRPYTDALRKQGGWRKDYESRAGGDRLVIFDKWVSANRKLELQLADTGNHRVSFWIYTDKYSGRMSTPPTYFQGVAAMRRAIDVETRRKPAKRIPLKAVST